MKKHIFIFICIILYAEILFPQAVNIQLIATDGTFNIQLAFGLDLTATNCIDSLLGEADPGIIPPQGIFDIRFDLTPYGCGPVSTYKDYRPPGDPPAFPFTGTVQHSLYWQRSVSGIPVDITYDLPMGVIMTITDIFGGILLNLGPFIGQGTATIPGTYPLNSALLFVEYNDIVPVELTSFTASILENENSIQLNWTTATETNNLGFEVQRSEIKGQPAGGEVSLKGGKSEPAYRQAGWEKIGFVPGFGTTTEPKSYSFTDKDITSGTYKYRLKQIDFDGTFIYSKEIEVDVNFTPGEFVLYQNYPNPFNPITTIKFALPDAVNVTLTIYNALGQKVAELVNSNLEAGNYNYKWNAKNAATGIYIYELRTDKYISNKKMLLLK